MSPSERRELERATTLAERYGEAIISISAALNADGLNDKGRIMRVRGVIAGLDKSQPDHGPGEPSERPIWNLFCPEGQEYAYRVSYRNRTNGHVWHLGARDLHDATDRHKELATEGYEAWVERALLGDWKRV